MIAGTAHIAATIDGVPIAANTAAGGVTLAGVRAVASIMARDHRVVIGIAAGEATSVGGLTAAIGMTAGGAIIAGVRITVTRAAPCNVMARLDRHPLNAFHEGQRADPPPTHVSGSASIAMRVPHNTGCEARNHSNKKLPLLARALKEALAALMGRFSRRGLSLDRIVHIELDRMRHHAEPVDLFDFQVDI